MAKFNTGQSFADGDTVTGAKLNNITSQLNIYTGVISEQAAMSATVSTADQLLIADTDNGDSGAANRITVQKLFSDSLTNGTFASANLTGTITSNRTVATSATITTGTIPNLTSSTANITLGTIPTLTAGTTTGTAGIFTSGTVATLNSTTGTITNLSTTLAGDFTISQGTGTLGTSGVTLGTYGSVTAIPFLTVDAKGRITSATTGTFSTLPTGAVMSFAMNSVPSGWLETNGAAVSRTTYANLFASTSTTFGTGDGSTTFNLPDLRGIFVRGNGSQTIGTSTYSGTFAEKQNDEFKAHTHPVTVPSGSGLVGGGGSAGLATSGNTSSAGGTETRPANIALFYCIKF